MPIFKNLTDKRGNLFFPITRESAVFDNNGVDLTTKLNSFLSGNFEFVNVLPVPSASTVRKIYLVPSSNPAEQNTKDEYVTVREGNAYRWEQIGSTSINLAGYVTTATFTTTLQDYVTKTELRTALADCVYYDETALIDPLVNPSNYYTIAQIDALLAGLSPGGGGSITVDAALSNSSTNPVQNRVVKAALDNKQDTISNLQAIIAGATAGSTAYQLPVGGIPATDLASGVIPANISAFYNDVGYLTQHQDISGKVDKVTGKGLSTNDYTNDDRDTLRNAVPMQFTLLGERIDAKQDTISDLSTIRSGAAAGATAYQKPVNGIPASDIAAGVIPTIPTNVSTFVNDSGYLTQHQDISGKQDKSTITSDSSNTTIVVTIANNNEYRYTANVLSLTLNLPSTISSDFTSWLVFVSGTTATSFTYPNTIKWSGDNVTNNVFLPATGKTYNIGFWYDGVNVNAVVRGV